VCYDFDHGREGVKFCRSPGPDCPIRFRRARSVAATGDGTTPSRVTRSRAAERATPLWVFLRLGATMHSPTVPVGVVPLTTDDSPTPDDVADRVRSRRHRNRHTTDEATSSDDQ